MAKEPKFLSFHTNQALQHSTHGFSLLQASKRELQNGRTGLHAHDFWQLELILKGSCQLEAGPHKQKLTAGTYTLIPPKQEHIFYYNNTSCHLISVKFMWSEQTNNTLIIADIEPTSFTAYIADLYEAAAESEMHLPGFSTAMLAYLLTLFPDDVPIKSQESTLVSAVDEIIHRQQGRAISVQEIASELHYSVNHLSAAYAKDADQTIKHKIDATRCEYAKQLLRYEEDSVSEIANLLDFPDVFSFSRFFHRVSGMRPKEFRKTEL